MRPSATIFVARSRTGNESVTFQTARSRPGPAARAPAHRPVIPRSRRAVIMAPVSAQSAAPDPGPDARSWTEPARCSAPDWNFSYAIHSSVIPRPPRLLARRHRTPARRRPGPHQGRARTPAVGRAAGRDHPGRPQRLRRALHRPLEGRQRQEDQQQQHQVRLPGLPAAPTRLRARPPELVRLQQPQRQDLPRPHRRRGRLRPDRLDRRRAARRRGRHRIPRYWAARTTPAARSRAASRADTRPSSRPGRSSARRPRRWSPTPCNTRSRSSIPAAPSTARTTPATSPRPTTATTAASAAAPCASTSTRRSPGAR